MAKRPLPLNPSPLPDLPPLLPSEPSKPSSPLDQPPVKPLIPVPWNIHHQEYSSMEISVAVARLGADLQAGAGRLWRPG